MRILLASLAVVALLALPAAPAVHERCMTNPPHTVAVVDNLLYVNGDADLHGSDAGIFVETNDERGLQATHEDCAGEWRKPDTPLL